MGEVTIGEMALPDWRLPDEVARVLSMGLIGAVSEATKDWLMTGYTQPRAVRWGSAAASTASASVARSSSVACARMNRCIPLES